MDVWVTTCLTRPDGLIADHLRGDGSIDEHAWTYNQGAMVAAGALLYAVTGDRRFLKQAQSLAARAVAHFADFRGEPPIFIAIFFRDLQAAAAIDKNSDDRTALQAYADQAWNRDRLGPRSALFTFGRSPTILDQAAMVQIYATLAGSR
jgi:predicted alpha-1,6-mannanase (GH76 family)